ncbi:hypothetical protein FRB94_007924 [Tulasnella sp. JGI-2019a]|nr:hypothetical protein FRB94_007924 [Tulasnella sp. JGI-2019a]
MERATVIAALKELEILINTVESHSTSETVTPTSEPALVIASKAEPKTKMSDPGGRGIVQTSTPPSRDLTITTSRTS